MALTVISVLRSSPEYDAGWVEKLKNAVARHLTVPHTFKCLSDVPVPCERVEMKEDWPGWWAKIELFRPGVITGPSLYLDLDTVIVASIDHLAHFKYDFAMMRNLNAPYMPGSAVMWFGKPPSSDVYDRFRKDPHNSIMAFNSALDGCYVGDQAFIWETYHRKVPYLSDDVKGAIRSYRRHCKMGIPPGCSIVAFGGKKKPNNVPDDWVRVAWR